MGQSNLFRRNADACFAGAKRAETESEKIAWLARAERWLQLAREAEAKPDNEPLTPSAPKAPSLSPLKSTVGPVPTEPPTPIVGAES